MISDMHDMEFRLGAMFFVPFIYIALFFIYMVLFIKCIKN